MVSKSQIWGSKRGVKWIGRPAGSIVGIEVTTEGIRTGTATKKTCQRPCWPSGNVPVSTTGSMEGGREQLCACMCLSRWRAVVRVRACRHGRRAEQAGQVRARHVGRSQRRSAQTRQDEHRQVRCQDRHHGQIGLPTQRPFPLLQPVVQPAVHTVSCKNVCTLQPVVQPAGRNVLNILVINK